MENFLLGFSGAERATLALIVTFLGAIVMLVIHGVSHGWIELGNGDGKWRDERPTTDGEIIRYTVAYFVFFVIVIAVFSNPSIM